ncbi:baseplate complex protein [Pseudoalteromonas sp. S16_S37]|uniref:baseplate complex protein n=1 Tax=Pseudoalteromonas sp. S16_S37 TaxID=2720228 RepID=UPI00168147ED|nr:hypothetical protein [Pseudoalteromonas sp. S16_S37]MBD1582809.1 hypothetical protein [Pseudoalteromonas sp. S16_S37]
MTISLDGWQVPGFNIKVAVGVKLAGGDLSGYGSFALSSDNGVKPAIITVKTNIAMVDVAELEDLISKAKALDANGARMVYTINNAAAQAYKVRKAKFDGDVKATELEELKGWQVIFKLLEVKSISEREQQHRDKTASNNSVQQANTGHESVQSQFEQVEGP